MKRDVAQDPQVQEVLKTQQLTEEEQFMIAQSPNFNLLRDMREQIDGDSFLDRRVSLDNKAREVEEQKKREAELKQQEEIKIQRLEKLQNQQE